MKLTVTKISLGGNPTGGICLAFLRCVFSNVSSMHLEVVGGMAIEATAFHPIPPSLPFAIVCLGKRTTTSEDKSNKNKNHRRNSGGTKKTRGVHFLTAPLSGSWGENQDDDDHRPCCRTCSSTYSHIKGIIIMQRCKKRQIWQTYCYSFEGSAKFWTMH